MDKAVNSRLVNQVIWQTAGGFEEFVSIRTLTYMHVNSCLPSQKKSDI